MFFFFNEKKNSLLKDVHVYITTLKYIFLKQYTFLISRLNSWIIDRPLKGLKFSSSEKSNKAAYKYLTRALTSICIVKLKKIKMNADNVTQTT